MTNRQLTNLEIKNLAEAIDESFSIYELNAFLEDTVQQTLDDISLRGQGMQKNHLVRQVVQHFNRRETAAQLFAHAYTERQELAKWQEVATTLPTNPQTPQQLSHTQLTAIVDLFETAFTIPELDAFLQDYMNTALEDIVVGVPIAKKIYLIRDVIRYYNRRNQAQKFAIDAWKARPRNAQLAQICGAFGRVTTTPPTIEWIDGQTHTFERIVNTELGIEDFAQWVRNASQIQHKICQIEIPVPHARPISGTGFLVGPDVVITNYHVMQDVIAGTYAPETVRLRFDYTLLDDGITTSPGTLFGLANDWLIQKSEPDWTNDGTGNLETAPDKLDFVLLRLTEAVGHRPIAKAPLGVDPHERGWFQLPQAPHSFETDNIVIIVQHPDRKPMSIALDHVTKVNTQQTRVRYRTNTEKGSSGSPCFDSRWNPVALHHVGDRRNPPDYNQGIPLYTIVQSLSAEAKTAVNLPL